MRYDLVIRNGTVIDGLRLPRFRGDVAVKDGKIARIGRIPAGAGTEEYDASGLIVAPGFVDLHTHYDAQLHWDPWCTSGSWHGVTTVVMGNCGFGFAPLKPSDRAASMRSSGIVLMNWRNRKIAKTDRVKGTIKMARVLSRNMLRAAA